MLNKDCKVRQDVNQNNNKSKTKKSVSKKSRNRKPSSKSKKTNKKNKFFYIMVVVWMIPVFISGYLLYLQYKQYVKNSQARILARSSRRNKPYISREQIRKLRRRLQSDQNSANSNKKAKIYIIKVNHVVGRAYLKSISTDLNLSDKNNISKAIKELLKYRVSENMRNKNYYSCIPERTQLLGYRIKNNTLLLNLNGNFKLSNGTQQIKLKAAQIVYTATQFPGIKNVKFIVNNRTLRDWGGEGVFPSALLSRSDVPRIMKIN